MNEFNVISKCDVCKNNKQCKEVIVSTIDKKQKLYFLCEECSKQYIKRGANNG